jgi:hypothetical protein
MKNLSAHLPRWTRAAGTKHNLAVAVGGTLFMVALTPCALAKPKQAVPRETVLITSPCANIWQPLLHLIDEEYAINFIYDPWFRVSFAKPSTAVNVFGGSYPWAAVQLRSEPASNSGAILCIAEIYGDGRLDPEVTSKIVAALPGASVVPPKPQGSGKQKINDVAP